MGYVATREDGITFPTSVVQDGSGRVWVAVRNGVGMYDGGQWRRWQRPGELADSKIGQLSKAPDGKLWTLPEYGGPPSVVDPATGQAETAPGLAESRVYALAFAEDATWAGTSNGLLRLKGGSQRLLNQAGGLPGRRGHYAAGDARHALDRHDWRPGRLRSHDRADHRHG